MEITFNYTLYSLGLGVGLVFWLFSWGMSKVFTSLSRFTQ